MAASAVLNNLVKLVSYSQNGLLTADMALPIAALAASGFATAFLGRAILKRLKLKAFEIGVQALLAIAATALLI